MCEISTGVRVANLRGGYLANLVTEATGCGNIRIPWLIVVKAGQIIRLTLYDFSLAAHVEQRRRDKASGYPIMDDPWPGQAYAVVNEPGDGHNLTIYGGRRTRKSVVFTSRGHEVEVAILTNDDISEVVYYLLKYEGRWYAGIC